jgi:hypothetical protein
MDLQTSLQQRAEAAKRERQQQDDDSDYETGDWL